MDFNIHKIEQFRKPYSAPQAACRCSAHQWPLRTFSMTPTAMVQQQVTFISSGVQLTLLPLSSCGWAELGSAPGCVCTEGFLIVMPGTVSLFPFALDSCGQVCKHGQSHHVLRLALALRHFLQRLLRVLLRMPRPASQNSRDALSLLPSPRLCRATNILHLSAEPSLFSAEAPLVEHSRVGRAVSGSPPFGVWL